MVMESPIWSFMVCGLVWYSIVYYANVFPCKVLNGLVWLCIVLYGVTQLCTLLCLFFFIGCKCKVVSKRSVMRMKNSMRLVMKKRI